MPVINRIFRRIGSLRNAIESTGFVTSRRLMNRRNMASPMKHRTCPILEGGGMVQLRVSGNKEDSIYLDIPVY